MDMVPSLAAIRDGMRIEMRPKVILLGSEMRAEQDKSGKTLSLKPNRLRKRKPNSPSRFEAQKDIAEIKVKTVYEDEKREQELKERIRQIKIEAAKRKWRGYTVADQRRSRPLTANLRSRQRNG
jgi:hypothetical protein